MIVSTVDDLNKHFDTLIVFLIEDFFENIDFENKNRQNKKKTLSVQP